MIAATEMEFICAKCNSKMSPWKSFEVDVPPDTVVHIFRCKCGEIREHYEKIPQPSA